jgi:three-Cys-motif partner protein
MFPSDWFVIDMFAGRGRYTDGGSNISGSPLVYLEEIATLHRKLKANGIHIHIFLVEKNRQNLRYLEENVESFLDLNPELNDFVTLEIMLGDCNNADIWSKIASMQLETKTPVFMFVDPYGIAIRRETMDHLVALPGAKDIMFNYMVCGVKRARGIAIKPEEMLSKREQSTVATCVDFVDVELNEMQKAHRNMPAPFSMSELCSSGWTILIVGTLYYLYSLKNRKIADMAREMLEGKKKNITAS